MYVYIYRVLLVCIIKSEESGGEAGYKMDDMINECGGKEEEDIDFPNAMQCWICWMLNRY